MTISLPLGSYVTIIFVLLALTKLTEGLDIYCSFDCSHQSINVNDPSVYFTCGDYSGPNEPPCLFTKLTATNVSSFTAVLPIYAEAEMNINASDVNISCSGCDYSQFQINNFQTAHLDLISFNNNLMYINSLGGYAFVICEDCSQSGIHYNTATVEHTCSGPSGCGALTIFVNNIETKFKLNCNPCSQLTVKSTLDVTTIPLLTHNWNINCPYNINDDIDGNCTQLSFSFTISGKTIICGYYDFYKSSGCGGVSLAPTQAPTEMTNNPTLSPTKSTNAPSSAPVVSVLTVHSKPFTEEIWFWGLSGGILLLILICILIFVIYSHKKAAAIRAKTMLISNPMCVFVAIGDYEDDPKDPDFDGYVNNLDVDIDIRNLCDSFGNKYRYDIYPKYDDYPKIEWTQDDLINLLTKQAKIFSNNVISNINENENENENKLNYDGLLV
eukprot:389398_1